MSKQGSRNCIFGLPCFHVSLVQNNPPLPIEILELLGRDVLFKINRKDALDVLLVRSLYGKALLFQGLLNTGQVREHLFFFLVPQTDQD